MGRRLRGQRGGRQRGCARSSGSDSLSRGLRNHRRVFQAATLFCSLGLGRQYGSQLPRQRRSQRTRTAPNRPGRVAPGAEPWRGAGSAAFRTGLRRAEAFSGVARRSSSAISRRAVGASSWLSMAEQGVGWATVCSADPAFQRLARTFLSSPLNPCQIGLRHQPRLWGPSGPSHLCWCCSSCRWLYPCWGRAVCWCCPSWWRAWPFPCRAVRPSARGSSCSYGALCP